MHCSFVFPEDIPRPYLGEIMKVKDADEDKEFH